MLIALGKANIVISCCSPCWLLSTRNSFVNPEKVVLFLVRHRSRCKTVVRFSNGGRLCAAALWWLESTPPHKVPAAAAIYKKPFTKRSKIKYDARACSDNHLMPTGSPWASPWTQLSSGRSLETWFLNRRPDRKPRSRTDKNELFFQKLQWF